MTGYKSAFQHKFRTQHRGSNFPVETGKMFLGGVCFFAFCLLLLPSGTGLRIPFFIGIYKRRLLVVVSSNNTDISNIYSGRFQWKFAPPLWC